MAKRQAPTPIRLSVDTLAAVDVAAERRGISRHAFIVKCVERAVEGERIKQTVGLASAKRDAEPRFKASTTRGGIT